MASRVTALGGDGFIGRYVVQALLRDGAMVTVASRNPKRGWLLKTQANLGQIAYAMADVTKPETLARAVAGADSVINLVGSFANMDAVQSGGAASVARAASEAGVKSLVHMSAIGADQASPSRYGRSKGDGEAAVCTAFPGATIMRPSLVFGREDALVNRFAALIRMLPAVPVFSGGTKFQLVFVGDVARAVVAALSDPAARGATYELGGPETLTMLALNQRIAAASGRAGKLFVEMPDMAGAAMAKLTGWLPGAPITRDQWLMLQSDNVVADGASGVEALGIVPASLSAVAERWLVLYRRHGRFGSTT